MPRFALKIDYDGGPFSGWQKQANAPSVQSAIEAALARLDPAAPGITDITPYWRPASWAAGVVVVDALSWGDADDGLVERWDALPEWPQMLLRALMFRLAVHALHPLSSGETFPGLLRTSALVRMAL